MERRSNEGFHFFHKLPETFPSGTRQWRPHQFLENKTFVYLHFFKMYIYLYFKDASKRFLTRFFMAGFYAATQII